jgi:hypothetical protein
VLDLMLLTAIHHCAASCAAQCRRLTTNRAWALKRSALYRTKNQFPAPKRKRVTCVAQTQTLEAIVSLRSWISFSTYAYRLICSKPAETAGSVALGKFRNWCRPSQPRMISSQKSGENKAKNRIFCPESKKIQLGHANAYHRYV